MQYISHYDSPLGDVLLAADETGLTGLWFEGQKHYACTLTDTFSQLELPVLLQAQQWLDIYFSGRDPEFSLPLHFSGTPFQTEVWNILSLIPYGKTATYGDIARQIAARHGLPHMSAQAVGSAVGRNPISIVIPCHRVVGCNGKMTGYAAGLHKKAALLTLEGIIIPSPSPERGPCQQAVSHHGPNNP